MPRWLVAVLSVVATVLVVGGSVLTARAAIGHTRLFESSADLGCFADVTTPEDPGWCLRRIHRAEALVVPGRSEIRVVSRDAAHARMLVNRDPFSDGTNLAVSVVDGGLLINDDIGTAMIVSRDRLDALDAG